MKKFLFIFSISTVLISHSITAQQNNDTDNVDKHELKINATNLIIFSYLDGAYEHLINEESSFGVNLLFSLSDDEFFDEYRTFSITPDYRQYFSKKYAEGFFVEGFAMLNSGDSFSGLATIEANGDIIYENEDTYTDFASEFVGRGGIILGYRF